MGSLHVRARASVATSDKGWAVSVADEEDVQPIFTCKWHQACCTPQIIKHTQVHDKLAP